MDFTMFLLGTSSISLNGRDLLEDVGMKKGWNAYSG